jgi:Na+/H+-dicarboxylate symporter
MNRTLKLQLPSTGVLVVFGFVLGICAGIFFGEMAAALNPISKIYIRLLQMAIVPYITVSLVHGLGRLTPE